MLLTASLTSWADTIKRKFHEAVVDLTSGHVDRNVLLGPFVHANGDGDEIIAIEKIALADSKVQAEIAKLELPKGTVVISDPWIYGSDGIGDEERLYQCFLYLRDPNNSTEADSNHYAMPLPISPVVNTETMTVIRVDIMPTGADNTIKPVQKHKIQPPNEYIPEAQTLRTDLKPLNVVQPEGASFQVQQEGTSSVLSWQKWQFRVGFNQREGMVIYDVRYDNRTLFYRLSLSDMNIPYADPRHPFQKKSAFDLGDAGAGIMANDLKLGCDCLGSTCPMLCVYTSKMLALGGSTQTTALAGRLLSGRESWYCSLLSLSRITSTSWPLSSTKLERSNMRSAQQAFSAHSRSMKVSRYPSAQSCIRASLLCTTNTSSVYALIP
jgi:Cu2+-containing amine oxidase